MKNLQEATEKICELKGSLVALDALTTAMLSVMPPGTRAQLRPVFDQHAEVARTVLLHAPISEHSINAFERDVSRVARMLEPLPDDGVGADAGGDAVLLSVARIQTFAGPMPLTAATGFFFERDERLYLVSCRHVFFDAPSGHHPDRIEIELHVDAGDLARATQFSVPLYHSGVGVWRAGLDAGGDVDVAVIELQRQALPAGAVIRAWTPDQLETDPAAVRVGASLVILGFPLGFHDTLHHLPVVRQGQVGSSFGLRFQGQGYFLTDARTHRGTSGAPVVRFSGQSWRLLGVHAARLDMNNRDVAEDESLGLNSAWYADVLLTLTAA
jgi:S1-C subfamily serine protease